ncbi:MAG: methyltransferase domain-containing protein [Lewinella sp.]|nr:methyltransferase domain-containing protein [Lewinella sp.]
MTARLSSSRPGSWRWRLAQWLEIRWWRRYLGRHALDQYLDDKRDYWQRLLATLDFPETSEGRWLDAGCGPAGLFLLPPSPATDAVDPLLDQYRAAFPHLREADFPAVTFHSAPLEDWRPTYRYEHISCCNAINHVDDWSAALDRLTTLATPGGRLLLGVDVHRWSWCKVLFRWLPGDMLHPHQHDARDYQQALLARGWQIERMHTWKKGLIFSYWLVTAVLDRRD